MNKHLLFVMGFVFLLLACQGARALDPGPSSSVDLALQSTPVATFSSAEEPSPTLPLTPPPPPLELSPTSETVPAPALNESHATYGGIDVRVFYPASSSSVANLGDIALQIVRDGEMVNEGALFDLRPGDEGNMPLGYMLDPGFHNMDADAEMEIVLIACGRGAHCISPYSVILDYDEGQRHYEVVDRTLWSGEFSPQFSDLDGDGDSEVLSSNVGFSQAYEGYSLLGFAPIQVFALTPDGFQDITQAYPDLIRQDAERWWNAYIVNEVGARVDFYYGHPGVLAAHVADMCLLGEMPVDWEAAEAVFGSGACMEQFKDLREKFPSWEQFIYGLQTKLEESGYPCEVEFPDVLESSGG